MHMYWIQTPWTWSFRKNGIQIGSWVEIKVNGKNDENHNECYGEKYA